MYKIDIYNLTLVFENNYFENITNIGVLPVIQVLAENILFRNLTIKNSKISTLL